MPSVPPDPMCFDCWLAEDDPEISPKHLDNDGAPVVVDGLLHSPWRCLACEQRWLLLQSETSGQQWYQRCPR